MADHALRSLGYGVRGRCPGCGRGSLFDGFLTIAERCASCGLAFGGHDSGDGPAVAATFVLGTVIVGFAGLVELTLSPPLWVHAVLWAPLVIAGTAAVLRPLKGASVALQHTYRSVEEPEKLGGQ